jgi:hypothetical protein
VFDAGGGGGGGGGVPPPELELPQLASTSTAKITRMPEAKRGIPVWAGDIRLKLPKARLRCPHRTPIGARY